MKTMTCRAVHLSSFVLLLGLTAPSLRAQAPLVIDNIADRATYNLQTWFRVPSTSGYAYDVLLDGNPMPVDVTHTVATVDYHEVTVARTNISTGAVSNRLVRFIVQSERGAPEKGLIRWTPYPPIPSTAGELAGAQMKIIVPQSYPANLPMPVIVWLENEDGNARRANGYVTAPGFEANPIQIFRGAGSGMLPPAPAGFAGPLSYNATLPGLQSNKVIQIDSANTWTTKSGVLAASEVWPANSRIHLNGNLTVPAGLSLTIGAGTIVKLNPLANITNSGTVQIDGTLDQPVVFTATNVVWPEVRAGAWGGFVMNAGTARLIANGAIFTGGGGAPSWSWPGGGGSHRSEQPVLSLWNGAKAFLTNSAIVHTAGQIGNGYNADLTLDHTLYQRAITSGEYVGGVITINHSAIIEFPNDDGVVDRDIADADYDGIYFTTGTHILMNSLFGFAKDDVIDSGSGGAGTVLVTNCWVESGLHEAHAWSGGGRVASSFDTVLINSGQGIESGWTEGSADNSPNCFADRLFTTANSVGARFGDNYDWTYYGRLKLTNSLILHNYRDVFLKTWNSPGTGWQTNSWVDRLQQTDLRGNFLTAADARFPSNQVWNPAADGWRLAHWMTTPPEAPVGIGLALRTNRLTAANLTNGVPVRLSSFTTNFVSVDYTVMGTNGLVASGTLEFAPGETVKALPPFWPGTNQPLLAVTLKNPTHGEITSLAQAWYVASGATSGDTALVLPGSRWQYLDTGGNPGTAWRNLAYDDSTWSNNIAQFGFGDDDEQTKIRRAGTNGANTITFYFRQTFQVTNPATFGSLSMWMLRDDGGVVYLNGTEIFRSDSMPPAPFVITSQVLATNYNGGAAPPDNTVDRATLDAGLLQTGTNIVTVEIHQQAASSSDASFDFSLTGVVASAGSLPIIQRSPSNLSVPLGGSAVFSVEATGPAPLGYQWRHNGSQVLDSSIGPELTLTNVTNADAGAYQVVVINSSGSATSQVATLTISNADTDGDGILDGWEIDHGLIVGVDDSSFDPDGDGMTNLQEYTAGTDPQDKNSYLKVDAVAPSGSSSGYTVQFNAVADRDYSLLYADVVPTNFWAKLQDIAASPTNRVVTVTDASAPPARRFYRLVTPAQ